MPFNILAVSGSTNEGLLYNIEVVGEGWSELSDDEEAFINVWYECSPGVPSVVESASQYVGDIWRANLSAGSMCACGQPISVWARRIDPLKGDLLSGPHTENLQCSEIPVVTIPAPTSTPTPSPTPTPTPTPTTSPTPTSTPTPTPEPIPGLPTEALIGIAVIVILAVIIIVLRVLKKKD